MEPQSQNHEPANPTEITEMASEKNSQGQDLALRKPDSQSAPQPRTTSVVATFSPPLGQFIINSLLQAAAFVAAVAFGVYAVKSVTVGNSANQYAHQAVQQAQIANQLAVLAVCISNVNQVGFFITSFLYRKANIHQDVYGLLDGRNCLNLLSSPEWCSGGAARCSFTPLSTFASLVKVISQYQFDSSLDFDFNQPRYLLQQLHHFYSLPNRGKHH